MLVEHNYSILKESFEKVSNEECYSTVCSNSRIVLNISIDGVVISLLAKY